MWIFLLSGFRIFIFLLFVSINSNVVLSVFRVFVDVDGGDLINDCVFVCFCLYGGFMLLFNLLLLLLVLLLFVLFVNFLFCLLYLWMMNLWFFVRKLVNCFFLVFVVSDFVFLFWCMLIGLMFLFLKCMLCVCDDGVEVLILGWLCSDLIKCLSLMFLCLSVCVWFLVCVLLVWIVFRCLSVCLSVGMLIGLVRDIARGA